MLVANTGTLDEPNRGVQQTSFGTVAEAEPATPSQPEILTSKGQLGCSALRRMQERTSATPAPTATCRRYDGGGLKTLEEEPERFLRYVLRGRMSRDV
jgi:hypothetical protein